MARQKGTPRRSRVPLGIQPGTVAYHRARIEAILRAVTDGTMRSTEGERRMRMHVTAMQVIIQERTLQRAGVEDTPVAMACEVEEFDDGVREPLLQTTTTKQGQNAKGAYDETVISEEKLIPQEGDE